MLEVAFAWVLRQGEGSFGKGSPHLCVTHLLCEGLHGWLRGEDANDGLQVAGQVDQRGEVLAFDGCQERFELVHVPLRSVQNCAAAPSSSRTRYPARSRGRKPLLRRDLSSFIASLSSKLCFRYHSRPSRTQMAATCTA